MPAVSEGDANAGSQRDGGLRTTLMVPTMSGGTGGRATTTNDATGRLE